MSSPNRLAHRRRSHSASSPIPRRQPDDVKWRISAKRSRPSSIRSPSYKELARDQPPEKWDVDQWRRGKRARRDSNTEESSDEASGFGYSVPSSDPILPTEQTPTLGFPSTSRLPCSSAAFQFFPQKSPRRQSLSGSRSARARLARDASPRDGERISPDEARRLRTNALADLHRSVAESSEGLVRRMRDWERSRRMSARSERQALGSPSALDAPHQLRKPGRRPTSYYGTPQAAAMVAEQSEDDEDDLFIVGETCSLPMARSPAHKKRALSLSMMDVDHPETEALPSPFASLGGSERSSSPIDHSSGPSACSSDDEGQADMDTDLSSSGVFSTPALSHTYSVSTNSSLVSLPLSLQGGEGATTAIKASTSSTTVHTCYASPSAPYLPSTASRSEKAIAALTLAMANGAAGINDYDALRMTEELTTLDETHAGELWN
ncbi:hypothetical protein C8Q76DRAFT_791884 [Earliella scabrosa]|nr:hypothetical protein C8Q76DRAFT_791884 [Earliella scabrosa]